MSRKLFLITISLFLIALFCPFWISGAMAADLTELVDLDKGRLRYDRSAKVNYVDIALINISQEDLRAPFRVVIDSISDPGVTLANPDGYTGNGKPYFDYLEPVLLLPGEKTVAKQWRFLNPQRRRFDFTLLEITGEISGENLPPQADAGQNRAYILEPEQTATTVTLDGSASLDPDGQIVAYVWDGNPDPADVINPQVTLQVGVYNFNLIVTNDDGDSSAPASVVITVEPAGSFPQHPPELLVDRENVTIDAGGRATVNVTASDPDGDMVTIAATPGLANAEFAVSPGLRASGVFTLDSEPGQQGIYVMNFTARDPLGYTDSKTTLININRVNQPPELTVPAAVSVDEGDLLTVTVTASDPDHDILQLTATPLPENAIFVASTETLTFAPDFSQAGSYTVTCTADDGGLSDSSEVVITVNNVAPSPQPDTLRLVVNDPESPSLKSNVRITGAVNMDVLQVPQQIATTLITALLPTSARQGETRDIVIRGQSSGDFVTHFVSGLSQVDFGAGVTVNTVVVNSSNELSANITVAAKAEIGNRGITVTSGSETAVSMLAFTVNQGHSGLTGTVIDPEGGQPLSGALVTLRGTGLAATTNFAGTFIFPEVPTGHYQLLINAPNHELITMAVATTNGVTADLGEIETQSLVFDPTKPPGASLHSVLSRKVGDVTGNISIEEARQVIIDTMILVGGNEAGVLDAFGNQLNPYVEGTGLTSLRDFGVQFYAERLARGGGISLIEVLYDISFAFNWSPQRPTFMQLLNGLQSRVNQAWANPLDPMSALPIVLFNHGRTLNPDPPTLASTTQLNSFQAYLLINSFMSANYKEQQTAHGSLWLPTSLQALHNIVLKVLDFLVAPAYAADDPTYTKTWIDLMADLGISADEEPISEIVSERTVAFSFG